MEAILEALKRSGWRGGAVGLPATPLEPLGLVVSDFRDGTVGEIRAFASWQEALEAAGLR